MLRMIRDGSPDNNLPYLSFIHPYHTTIDGDIISVAFYATSGYIHKVTESGVPVRMGLVTSYVPPPPPSPSNTPSVTPSASTTHTKTPTPSVSSIPQPPDLIH
jgi:hypothetical protein